jgi:orotate phosphoribosyltransferase
VESVLASHDDIVAIARNGHERREEKFLLACGQWSHDYLDGKFAVEDGLTLTRVGEYMAATAGVEFDAVGGLTMGADPFAHTIAILKSCRWFSVRKEPKKRGLAKWIEGARLGPGDRVLLVDDVVTMGGSILDALIHVEETGARVVAATAFIDRGDNAAPLFAARGIPYAPLVTYRHLGIEPVVGSPGPVPVG